MELPHFLPYQGRIFILSGPKFKVLIALRVFSGCILAQVYLCLQKPDIIVIIGYLAIVNSINQNLFIFLIFGWSFFLQYFLFRHMKLVFCLCPQRFFFNVFHFKWCCLQLPFWSDIFSLEHNVWWNRSCSSWLLDSQKAGMGEFTVLAQESFFFWLMREILDLKRITVEPKVRW